MSNVLCIIQARMGSHRLPGKVLLPIGGVPLIEIAWRKACEAFGESNVLFTVPWRDRDLLKFLGTLNVKGEVWFGNENDLLGRFYDVAVVNSLCPSDVIFRYTPDDHRKSVSHMERVAAGEKGIPVELGGEAFTFAELKHAHETITDPNLREHIGYIFNPNPAPCPPGLWSINTEAEYFQACGEFAMDAA